MAAESHARPFGAATPCRHYAAPINCFGLDLFGRTHVASEFQLPVAKIDVGKLADRTELETLPAAAIESAARVNP
jgi:hypothetical protein